MSDFTTPEWNHSAKLFKLGDTVTLNSGGHVMTVVSIGDAKDVTCAWSLKDDIKTKTFPVEALKYGDPSPKTLAELVEGSIKTTAEPECSSVGPKPSSAADIPSSADPTAHPRATIARQDAAP